MDICDKGVVPLFFTIIINSIDLLAYAQKSFPSFLFLKKSEYFRPAHYYVLAERQFFDVKIGRKRAKAKFMRILFSLCVFSLCLFFSAFYCGVSIDWGLKRVKWASKLKVFDLKRSSF
jgi:hypothetical protein